MGPLLSFVENFMPMPYFVGNSLVQYLPDEDYGVPFSSFLE